MLLYEKAGNIGILTINRPEALNALNSALLDCLYEKVTEIAHDTELRCLIVTGAGKAFVAGADISEMKDGLWFHLVEDDSQALWQGVLG